MRTNRDQLRAWVWLAAAFIGCGVFVPSAMAAESGGIFQWRPFLGPFHSVLLHFPIGFVTMAFLVDLYYLWRRKPEVQQVITLMLGLSVATTLLTIALGLLRAGGAEYDARTLDSHRNYGIAVGVLTVLTLILQRRGYAEGTDAAPNRLLRGSYRVLLIANIALLVIAGHQGGNLTHGSNYLTKNAPEFVKILVEDEPETPDMALVGATEEDKFFLEKVKPIFDTKCLSCHGPEKQKGTYRLDQKAIALKGGSSEKTAVKAGDPMASHLVRLILLPPDHEDVMPPTGKGSLTPEEVMAIIRWVQQGAHYPEKPADVAAVEKPASTPLPTTEKPVAPKAKVVSSAKPNGPAKPAIVGKVDFVKHIKPVLETHCVSCHGPEKQRMGFRVDTREAAFKGGKVYGPAIVPGSPPNSSLYHRISMRPDRDIHDEVMPPAKRKIPLTAAEIALIGQWITEGANWPNGVTLVARPEAPSPKSAQR
ncbi:MAG: c-type cytochrome domain-containing protein [Limisphaerales bacterium]